MIRRIPQPSPTPPPADSSRPPRSPLATEPPASGSAGGGDITLNWAGPAFARPFDRAEHRRNRLCWAIEMRLSEDFINQECRLVLEVQLGGFWRTIAWLIKEKIIAVFIWRWEGLQVWLHDQIPGLHFRSAAYDGECWCCEVEKHCCMEECEGCKEEEIIS